MKPGDLITAKHVDPANAIFLVMSRTGNGWLKCVCVAALNPERSFSPYGDFAFRASAMTTDIEGQRRLAKSEIENRKSKIQ